MFEVKIYVEDKKLSSFLWALDGKIVGQPVILPVRGASSKGGKLISSVPNGNSLRARMLALIHKKKLKVISSTIISTLLDEAGASSSTMPSNVIEGLKKLGALGPPKGSIGQVKTYPVLKLKKGKVTRG